MSGVMVVEGEDFQGFGVARRWHTITSITGFVAAHDYIKAWQTKETGSLATLG